MSVYHLKDAVRCEALISGSPDRCRHRATRLRDGRQVCINHKIAPRQPRYIDGPDRFRTFAETMAKALGDVADDKIGADRALLKIMRVMRELAVASYDLTEIDDEQALTAMREIMKIAREHHGLAAA